MEFVHLHVHSHYSLLDGLPLIPNLVKAAKGFNMPAVALTDHGVMYGAIDFYRTCVKNEVKPIVGCELYLAEGSRHSKTIAEEKPYHLTVLAKNLTGYRNLMKLVSLAHMEGFYYKPRVDWELLEQYHDGLIVLSGCLNGEIPRTIIRQPEKGKGLVEKYLKTFGEGNFYLELQHHPEIGDQNIANQRLITLSKELSVPVVATNDAHYLKPEDAEVQDVMICIQTKKQQSDTNRMSMLGSDFSFRSPEQMAEEFSHIPEAISNTIEIANKCDLQLEFGKTLLPKFEVPAGTTDMQFLRNLCEEGIGKRYEEVTPEIRQRLEYELSVIEKTGFASYFLIVQDFVNWAKNNGVVVGPGRGSAAGSLVSYVINITDVDPIKFDLMFERFLNPDRISMPDIDMDFADIRRNDVLEYVSEKYGRDHVAQIITFGTMAARVGVRDVGRVLGLPYSYGDKIAKLIPMFTTLDQALEQVEELKQMYDSDPRAMNLINIAKKMEGVARHHSTHACGVLITPSPVVDHAPIQYASTSDNSVISQYSLHPVEDLGLLKMDFLGLKNLTIIEKALEIIEKTTGTFVDLNVIPLDDEKTYKLLQRGETTGVFQLESSGMRRYLVQLRPSNIEDVIVMISLYRPGPMELIPDYIEGKHGRKTITYLHPKLEPVLKKTFGIAVYQEQIMQISRELAGFTFGEADVLRKAVGKKNKVLLDEQESKMINGMVANDVPKDVAQKIWEYILPFARYGFNRAHAASYAMISYRTAYLKANYPAQFMASLMTADLDNLDKIAREIHECEKMGIKVLPPDVNESFSTFAYIPNAEQPTIRFGLQAIKNVGEHIASEIIHERKKNGPYADLTDLLKRVTDKDMNKKSLDSLIKAGALDRFGERGQLLANLDRLLHFSKQQQITTNQSSLFGAVNTSLRLDEAPRAGKEQKLIWEKELMGVYISDHPLSGFSHLLPKDVKTCRVAGHLSDGERVKVFGVITKIDKIITKKGQPMVFVSLEDESGGMELIVFSDVLEKFKDLIAENNIIVAQGKISTKDETAKIICETIMPRETLTARAKILKIDVSAVTNNDTLVAVKNILSDWQGPCEVYLIVAQNGQKKSVKLNTGANPNQRLLDELSRLIGSTKVVLD